MTQREATEQRSCHAVSRGAFRSPLATCALRANRSSPRDYDRQLYGARHLIENFNLTHQSTSKTTFLLYFPKAGATLGA